MLPKVMRTSGATRMHSSVRARLTICNSFDLQFSADPPATAALDVLACCSTAVLEANEADLSSRSEVKEDSDRHRAAQAQAQQQRPGSCPRARALGPL
jgi:hypothetical protein